MPRLVSAITMGAILLRRSLAAAPLSIETSLCVISRDFSGNLLVQPQPLNVWSRKVLVPMKELGTGVPCVSSLKARPTLRLVSPCPGVTVRKPRRSRTECTWISSSLQTRQSIAAAERPVWMDFQFARCSVTFGFCTSSAKMPQIWWRSTWGPVSRSSRNTLTHCVEDRRASERLFPITAFHKHSMTALMSGAVLTLMKLDILAWAGNSHSRLCAALLD
mmetsp:Transcript_10208/g.30840  ORF Transcript_10208/g.30840 Transcript_10208/m.30840 type:complete len:219 (+) Transcript_10208:1674-2330(+)